MDEYDVLTLGPDDNHWYSTLTEDPLGEDLELPEILTACSRHGWEVVATASAEGRFRQILLKRRHQE